MKTLAIIPARRDSRRLPGKQLRQLHGRTLVQRALDTCQPLLADGTLTRLVVSSNCPQVLHQAGKYALPRPDEMATADAPAVEYVEHALTCQPRGMFDAVCVILPTAPLIAAGHVSECLRWLQRDTYYESATTVAEVPHCFQAEKQFTCTELPNKGRECPPIKRRVRTAAAYALRVPVSHAISDLLPAPVAEVPVPQWRCVDVNTEAEWLTAELILAGLNTIRGGGTSDSARQTR